MLIHGENKAVRRIRETFLFFMSYVYLQPFELRQTLTSDFASTQLSLKSSCENLCYPGMDLESSLLYTFLKARPYQFHIMKGYIQSSKLTADVRRQNRNSGKCSRPSSIRTGQRVNEIGRKPEAESWRALLRNSTSPLYILLFI